MRSASTGWWRHMGRGSTWYLVLGSWSVPSPWSLVRRHAGHASQDRILKRGRRTSDQGRTKDQRRTKDQGRTKHQVLSTKYQVALCIGLSIALWTPPTAAQCAMCRRALESPEGQQMVTAFRSGILILLAAPFILFGLIATLVVRMQSASAKAARQAACAEASARQAAD